METKRRYPRTPVTGWVKVFEGEDRTFHANVKEISIFGIGLYAPIALPSGTSVKLEIRFMGRTGIEIVKELRGVVAWSLELGINSTLGIRFLEQITSENYPVLYAFLRDTKT